MPKAQKSAKLDPTESIRSSLVGLRRLFQRKELVEMWSAASGRAARLDYTELRLLDAVRSSTRASDDTGEGGVTVGEIARRLGVDPSRASRQVARAVKQGLLRRHAVQADGRKVLLQITAAGAKLQSRGSELTRARIALALDGWSAADREQLAALFSRFARAITDDD
jgi:DNA-binding MarR family transcriptional regulator